MKNIVKAYNLNGDYVILEADFSNASPEKSKLITIDTFIAEQDVDSIYFETPYFFAA